MTIRARIVAMLCLLLPAMVVALPLASGRPGTLTLVTLLAFACAAALLGPSTPYVVGRAPAPAIVRRRASRLPEPLAVTVPRVPHGPRAPGGR